MKFELVEFYESNKQIRDKYSKKCVGTVHIYAIDCELDIRGINIHKNGNNIYFNFPHFNGVDNETGEKVRYPIIRWTNETIQTEMMDFLRNEVKPEILKRLKEKENLNA